MFANRVISVLGVGDVCVGWVTYPGRELFANRVISVGLCVCVGGGGGGGGCILINACSLGGMWVWGGEHEI